MGNHTELCYSWSSHTLRKSRISYSHMGLLKRENISDMFSLLWLEWCGVVWYAIMYGAWKGTVCYGVAQCSIVRYRKAQLLWHAAVWYVTVWLILVIVLPHPCSSLLSPQSSTPLHFLLTGMHFLIERQLTLFLP